MRRENPERFSLGVPELSLILGRPHGGVSGDGVPCSTNSSNISVGGWGCHPVCLTHQARPGALSYSIVR